MHGTFPNKRVLAAASSPHQPIPTGRGSVPISLGLSARSRGRPNLQRRGFWRHRVDRSWLVRPVGWWGLVTSGVQRDERRSENFIPRPGFEKSPDPPVNERSRQNPKTDGRDKTSQKTQRPRRDIGSQPQECKLTWRSASALDLRDEVDHAAPSARLIGAPTRPAATAPEARITADKPDDPAPR